MNLYAHDLPFFDFPDFADPIIDPISISHHHHLSRSYSLSSSSNSSTPITRHGNIPKPKPKSPPRHRHDGTSPLPLGMDWSVPPRKWDGRDTVWPHDHHTGWSYCVTIPSWILIPKSRGSEPVVFYRVQVGIQSPEGITTTRGILRRFSDFIKLLSELKKSFPQKNLPRAPPKRILRTKSSTLAEERRCYLEDWMEKLLSDIDVSRSVSVGTFLELEAAARSSFDDVNQQSSDSNSPVIDMVPSLPQTNSDVSAIAGSSSVASYPGNDPSDETSELGTPRQERDKIDDLGMEASTSEQNTTEPAEISVKQGTMSRAEILGNPEKISRQKIHSGREETIVDKDKHAENMSKAKFSLGDGKGSLTEREYTRLDGHVRRLSTESIRSDSSSVRASEISNLGVANLFGDDSVDGLAGSDLQFPRDMMIAFPSDERHKLNRVLNTVQQRLATAKTDMEDLIARLNQETAVRQFLTTKVKDLEVDLETTRSNCKENIQQAVLSERERFTQMQWDVEELRRQCLEMELKLKYEQDEKAHAEAAKISTINENEMLLQQLDASREELENLHKDHEELELKSKADVKLLVKEVKSLRNSQVELKQELSRLMKEKLEVERALNKEKQRTEAITAANAKLLHECEILCNRLRECSVSFLIEEEDKLIVDSSSPSDSIDLLATSDNRIGLLLAEAQLLAQDVESLVARLGETNNTNGGDRTDNELRMMLTETFIDNARLRMQVNSVIRCALNTHLKADKDDEDEETPATKNALSKFLERKHSGTRIEHSHGYL